MNKVEQIVKAVLLPHDPDPREVDVEISYDATYEEWMVLAEVREP